jgi:hypothetical protein
MYARKRSRSTTAQEQAQEVLVASCTPSSPISTITPLAWLASWSRSDDASA